MEYILLELLIRNGDIETQVLCLYRSYLDWF